MTKGRHMKKLILISAVFAAAIVVAVAGATSTVTEYAATGAVPSAITPGSDGALWFGTETGNTLGRMATDGSFVETPLPQANEGIGGVTTGSDGAIWYATARTNQLGRYDLASGTFSECNLGTNGGGGLVTGSDGNLWVTASVANKVLVYSTSCTLLRSYAVGAFPHGPSLGPDGNVYFAEMNANKVASLSPAGVLKQWTLPQLNSKPAVTTPGPDGAIWFTASSVNRIGRLSLVGAGSVTTYPTAGAPWGITSGAGLVWFTEKSGNKVASINPTTHAIVQTPVPTPSSFPDKIALGSDGNLWFTEHNVQKIGKLVP